MTAPFRKNLRSFSEVAVSSALFRVPHPRDPLHTGTGHRNPEHHHEFELRVLRAQPDGRNSRVDVGFLEAVKRHILSRLQMRTRPNITHPIPKAAMVTALKKLHAGKVRADGRVEIPNVDGHGASSNEVEEETSEIISFAETGVCVSPSFS
ncbi:Inhibin beta B chain [Triplophysa tibetana]|uniref:Inhibin beta B chain n=1 Tax=Triplophysa tibetana TaxID=1572043 RepID=A0A5A9NG04_9TELE|nr:Inhibin beta B chain [Triplophysa tibetana]